MRSIGRFHKGMSQVNSSHPISLNFEIVSKECLTSAVCQLIQKGHAQFSEKAEGNKICLEPRILKTYQFWIFPVFTYVLEKVSDVTLSEINWIISVTAGQK